MITDLYGPISYTTRIDEVLEKYFKVLTDDGAIFIASNNSTSVINSAGSKISLTDWISTIEGISVKVVNRINNVDPGGPDEWGIKLTKLQERVEIPALELVTLEDGSPPTRVFKIILNTGKNP